MLSIPTSTLYTWLQLYDETKNLDFDKMHDTNDHTNNHTVRAMTWSKNTNNPSELVHKLIEFPFFATFISFVDQGKTTTSVQVLHHFFKASAEGVPFKEGAKKEYAWISLGPNAKVVSFETSAFKDKENGALSIPTRQDYVQVAGKPNEDGDLRGYQQEHVH